MVCFFDHLLMDSIFVLVVTPVSGEESTQAWRNSERLRNLPQAAQLARAEQGLEAMCACGGGSHRGTCNWLMLPHRGSRVRPRQATLLCYPRGRSGVT